MMIIMGVIALVIVAIIVGKLTDAFDDLFNSCHCNCLNVLCDLSRLHVYYERLIQLRQFFFRTRSSDAIFVAIQSKRELYILKLDVEINIQSLSLRVRNQYSDYEYEFLLRAVG